MPVRWILDERIIKEEMWKLIKDSGWKDNKGEDSKAGIPLWSRAPACLYPSSQLYVKTFKAKTSQNVIKHYKASKSVLNITKRQGTCLFGRPLCQTVDRKTGSNMQKYMRNGFNWMMLSRMIWMTWMTWTMTWMLIMWMMLVRMSRMTQVINDFGADAVKLPGFTVYDGWSARHLYTQCYSPSRPTLCHACLDASMLCYASMPCYV